MSEPARKVARRGGNDPSQRDEFVDLGLHNIPNAGQGCKRLRQHVNPLASGHQKAHGPLDWPAVFADPTLPLLVDVGCGYGRFVLKYAQAHPHENVLGVEIRVPAVERALKWTEGSEFEARTHFMSCNATLSMRTMLASYPGTIKLVCVQYPDPQFKKRKMKRHIVQPQFCDDVAAILPPAGRVFFCSDVHLAAQHMRDAFHGAASGHFEPDATLHAAAACRQDSATALAAPDDAVPASQTLRNSAGAGPPAAAVSTASAAAPDVVESQDQQEADAGREADHRAGGSAGHERPACADGADATDADDVAASHTAPLPHSSMRRAPQPADLVQTAWPEADWLPENPLDAPTERELHVQEQGLPTWRMMLVRK